MSESGTSSFDWCSFYALFWNDRGYNLKLDIPDTVLLRNGHISAWWATDKKGQIKRHPPHKTTWEAIRAHFIQSAVENSFNSPRFVAIVRKACQPPRLLRWKEFNDWCEEMSDLSDVDPDVRPSSIPQDLPFCVQLYTVPMLDLRYITTYICNGAEVICSSFPRRYSRRYLRNDTQGGSEMQPEVDPQVVTVDTQMKHRLQTITVSVVRHVQRVHGLALAGLVCEYVSDPFGRVVLHAVLRTEWASGGLVPQGSVTQLNLNTDQKRFRAVERGPLGEIPLMPRRRRGEEEEDTESEAGLKEEFQELNLIYREATMPPQGVDLRVPQGEVVGFQDEDGGMFEEEDAEVASVLTPMRSTPGRSGGRGVGGGGSPSKAASSSPSRTFVTEGKRTATSPTRSPLFRTGGGDTTGYYEDEEEEEDVREDYGEEEDFDQGFERAGRRASAGGSSRAEYMPRREASPERTALQMENSWPSEIHHRKPYPRPRSARPPSGGPGPESSRQAKQNSQPLGPGALGAAAPRGGRVPPPLRPSSAYPRLGTSASASSVAAATSGHDALERGCTASEARFTLQEQRRNAELAAQRPRSAMAFQPRTAGSSSHSFGPNAKPKRRPESAGAGGGGASSSRSTHSVKSARDSFNGGSAPAWDAEHPPGREMAVAVRGVAAAPPRALSRATQPVLQSQLSKELEAAKDELFFQQELALASVEKVRVLEAEREAVVASFSARVSTLEGTLHECHQQQFQADKELQEKEAHIERIAQEVKMLEGEVALLRGEIDREREVMMGVISDYHNQEQKCENEIGELERHRVKLDESLVLEREGVHALRKQREELLARRQHEQRTRTHAPCAVVYSALQPVKLELTEQGSDDDGNDHKHQKPKRRIKKAPTSPPRTRFESHPDDAFHNDHDQAEASAILYEARVNKKEPAKEKLRKFDFSIDHPAWKQTEK